MGVFERNGHWYFEVMIRKKRYCKAIPEATNRKYAEKYLTVFKIPFSPLSREWLDAKDTVLKPTEEPKVDVNGFVSLDEY